VGEYGIMLAFKNNQTMVVREKEKVGYNKKKKLESGRFLKLGNLMQFF
jgi:hypothetical protein